MKESVIEPWILYEDNHLLALDKPPLLLTQDSPQSTRSLESLARDYIKERDQKKAGVYLHAVHRLDKEACGVVLFAKTSKALSRLNKAMREGKFSKEYHAVVEGYVSGDEGEWENFISHGSHRAIIGKREGCSKAVLAFKCLKRGANRTHLHIDLKTGKYHQIRAQSSHRSHPVLGDKKYGSCFKGKTGGIALLHKTLQLEHPTTHVLIVIESKQDVKAWL
ncbi:RNA pseudouridine synthase [Candidatus Aerophobetes bacterium]|uniref:RNA pseudouridine synthase n=1 Tax=Aerophobetes bacterium TaxID=2030807 RepID=A0A2A4X288_UNCAE|nr:MAG: RNA pseudouridine synthase [Candidatus Aerophobetes bacterium]